MLEIGTVLAGNYEILRKIGEGGTSVVYLAMNPRANQQWVIKEIAGNSNSKDTQRVIAEARMMQKFDHYAIPRVTDILINPDVTYIVMDYISGQSLAHELKENGPISQEKVLDWAKQLCDVLVYLHSLETPIIYHDLKPGNIILKKSNEGDKLKLIDFGEARPCINGNAPGGGRTKEYAAPEQQKECKGNTDERTDIYCFGTTLYRLLSGKFPPKAPEPVGSIRERFPELQISKGMDRIIRKCTQVDPNKRFQSAKELKRALDNIQLWDEDYIKRLKRRIIGFGAMLGLSAVMVGAGLVFSRMEIRAEQQNYESLIESGKSEKNKYADRKRDLMDAIDIDGGNPEAYLELLKLYEGTKDSAGNVFEESESAEFTAKYSANRSKLEAEDENNNLVNPDVLELNFKAGHMYFTMYAGDGGEFRSKVQKAYSYFQFVENYGAESFQEYPMAHSYYKVCDFFMKYVLDNSNVKEPKKEVYIEMMEELQNCLVDMKSYAGDDAVNTRLKIYEQITNMLNLHIRGFVFNEIPKEDLNSVISALESALGSEPAALNRDYVDQVLAQIANLKANVEIEYNSVK